MLMKNIFFLVQKFMETSKNSLKTVLPENVIGNFKNKVNKFLHAEWENPLQLLEELDQYKFLLTNEVRKRNLLFNLIALIALYF